MSVETEGDILSINVGTISDRRELEQLIVSTNREVLDAILHCDRERQQRAEDLHLRVTDRMAELFAPCPNPSVMSHVPDPRGRQVRLREYARHMWIVDPDFRKIERGIGLRHQELARSVTQAILKDVLPAVSGRDTSAIAWASLMYAVREFDPLSCEDFPSCAERKIRLCVRSVVPIISGSGNALHRQAGDMIGLASTSHRINKNQHQFIDRHPDSADVLQQLRELGADSPLIGDSREELVLSATIRFMPLVFRIVQDYQSCTDQQKLSLYQGLTARLNQLIWDDDPRLRSGGFQENIQHRLSRFASHKIRFSHHMTCEADCVTHSLDRRPLEEATPIVAKRPVETSPDLPSPIGRSEAQPSTTDAEGVLLKFKMTDEPQRRAGVVRYVRQHFPDATQVDDYDVVSQALHRMFIGDRSAIGYTRNYIKGLSAGSSSVDEGKLNAAYEHVLTEAIRSFEPPDDCRKGGFMEHLRSEIQSKILTHYEV